MKWIWNTVVTAAIISLTAFITNYYTQGTILETCITHAYIKLNGTEIVCATAEDVRISQMKRRI